MITETLILKTQLYNLFHPYIIHHLCRNGWRKTENKFSLEFHGSKGYFSHLVISCEGCQNEADNRLFKIFNKDGSIRKKVVNVFHSEKNGVRLSLGSDKARVVEQPKYENKLEAVPANETESDNDLPF